MRNKKKERRKKTENIVNEAKKEGDKVYKRKRQEIRDDRYKCID